MRGVIAAMLVAVLWPAPGFAQSADGITVRQGGVVWLEVAIQPRDSAPWGSYKGRDVVFSRVDSPGTPGTFIAPLGVDMQATPGVSPLEVKVRRGGASHTLARVPVTIVDAKFPVQRLTLPDTMVDLDAPTLARVKREKADVGALWRSTAQKPLWRGAWRMPVGGDVSGSFGKRRVINGQPRSPHNGEDIPAPAGTPVVAPAAGIVRLPGDRFFGGKTVFLEHGGGLFTFYMHLSRVDVSAGQTVALGDPLGQVGASGRATGPHLHWGGRLGGARINPVELVRTETVRLSSTP